jgi:hypothetical protein
MTMLKPERDAAEAAGIVRRRCAERADRRVKRWAAAAALGCAVLAFVALQNLRGGLPKPALRAALSIGDIAGEGLSQHADALREKLLAYLADEGVEHDAGSDREVRIEVWAAMGGYGADDSWRLVVLQWRVEDGHVACCATITQSGWVRDSADLGEAVSRHALRGAARGIRKAMERAQ